MYAFHSVDGYSKVGSYTGNANADGTFVYLGFKPAMVIRKRATGATGHWNINDNKRIGYNGSGSNGVLYPNATYTEGDADRVDLLSNGFKVKTEALKASSSKVFLDYMNQSDADIFVMGNSRRRLFTENILGDIVKKMVRHADRPIFLAE